MKVPFTLPVTWFPDLEFTHRSYSKLRVNLLLFHASWNSSLSSGSNTLPVFNVQYEISRSWFSHSSDCSATIFLVHISAIAAAVLYGLYSFASTFSFLWLVFLDLLVDFSISQWSLSEYKCWIGHNSMCDFGVRSLTSRMTSYLPWYKSSTIPMLHFLLFLDRRQPGPIKSVLFVIIGWLVCNAVFSETALRIFLIFAWS